MVNASRKHARHMLLHNLSSHHSIFSTGLSFDLTFLPRCRFHTLSFLKPWVKEKWKCKLFFEANDGWPFPKGELEMMILIEKRKINFSILFLFFSVNSKKINFCRLIKNKICRPARIRNRLHPAYKMHHLWCFFFFLYAVPKRNPPFAT